MSKQDYFLFSKVRERALLGGRHFSSWCSNLLRSSCLSLPALAIERRFLGRLITTRLVQIVESANRIANQGTLAQPRTALRREHYQHAINNALLL